MTRTAPITALLATALASGAAGAQAAFEFEELAPGVVAAVVDPEVPSYAFANSLIVIGDDGVLVVDTQQSPRAAMQVIREIRDRTSRPVRWVVNTHWHGDHTWGNQVYADSFPDAVFIATPATRDTLGAVWGREVAEQRERTLASLDRLRGMLEEETDSDRRQRIVAAMEVRRRYLDDLAGLRRVLPDRLVRDSLSLDLGGRVAVLISVGPAHTPGDLAVAVPGDGIMHVGDLIEEGELWTEGADIRGWIAALDRVEARRPRALIPGHGGVQRDLELLRSQRQELRRMAAEPDATGR